MWWSWWVSSRGGGTGERNFGQAKENMSRNVLSSLRTQRERDRQKVEVTTLEDDWLAYCHFFVCECSRARVCVCACVCACACMITSSTFVCTPATHAVVLPSRQLVHPLSTLLAHLSANALVNVLVTKRTGKTTAHGGMSKAHR